jgi:hypothetical protein
VTATLARRLGKIEATARVRLQGRFDAAVAQLRATMDPEHGRQVADWLRANIEGKQLGPCTGDAQTHVCPRCLDRLHPPALARAVWLMLLDHVLTSGAPVAMPPIVAEVYLADPDAYPANPCGGCGYLLPTRSTVRPDGTYRHLAWYMGECPVCGLDNHPEEEASA